MTSTTSATRAARRTSAAIAAGSSGCTSLMRGQAPICSAREASMRELLSVTSPGPSAEPIGWISSPVGMIAATGRRAISSVTCPVAAAAARSAVAGDGLPGAATGRPGSPRPLARTFNPGPAPVPAIRALPSEPSWTRSRSTTVSMPAGTGSPVSTQANEDAASRHRLAASAGRPADGRAFIAMPSIAAQAAPGDGRRARTGAAVTLPSASRIGTCSATGSPSHPTFVHASVHCA